jgi:hypothetical protein
LFTTLATFVFSRRQLRFSTFLSSQHDNEFLQYAQPGILVILDARLTRGGNIQVRARPTDALKVPAHWHASAGPDLPGFAAIPGILPPADQESPSEGLSWVDGRIMRVKPAPTAALMLVVIRTRPRLADETPRELLAICASELLKLCREPTAFGLLPSADGFVIRQMRCDPLLSSQSPLPVSETQSKREITDS